jgi:DNA-binding transcriptional LysR family regulator
MSLVATDLNLFLVLDAVLSEKSVVRAARRLHVTPSAVSNALARLRTLLRDPLVLRKGRGIVPTPHALELAPQIARALSELDAVLKGPTFDPKTTLRRFTIALSDGDHLALLPRLAALFEAEMPRARLCVASVDTLVASGGLGGAEVDLAVGPMKQGPGIRTRRLYEVTATLLMRKKRGRVRLSREEFNSMRHVDVRLGLGQGGIGQLATGSILGQYHLVRNVAVEVPSFAAAAEVVAATDLIALVPSTIVAQLCARLPVRPVVGPMPPLRLQLDLAWHERTEQDAASAAFRDMVVRAAAPFSGGGTERRG